MTNEHEVVQLADRDRPIVRSTKRLLASGMTCVKGSAADRIGVAIASALLFVVLTACTRGATPAPLPVAVSSPPGDPTAQTITIDYTPTVPTGAPVEGVCWSNSRAVASLGAWRCLVSEKIFDPCFQLPDGGIVCDANPARGQPGFLVQLTVPLPRPNLTATSQARVWLLELVDGTVCRAPTETTTMAEGNRVSYVCSAEEDGDAFAPETVEPQVVVLGDLKEGTVWTAEKATLSSDADGVQVRGNDAVAIRRLWQYRVAEDTTTVNRAQSTTVIDYRPERPAGAALVGSCLTNSLAVPSRGAWRCTVDSQILDPCFALDDGQHVVCDPNPLIGDPGVLVRLDDPLPQPDLVAERESHAWLLELEDRTVCNLATSATGLVDGKRISYLCSEADADNTVVILGEPRTGTIWTAEKATLNLRDGKFTARDSATVAIRTIVRGPEPFVPVICEALADGMSEVLGADIARSEAPFIDPLTGNEGTGCQVSVAKSGGPGEHAPDEIVRKMLLAQGWQEDSRYLSSGPSTSTHGFRKGSELCLLHASQQSTRPDGSPGEAPQTSRKILVQQPSSPLTLSCARDSSTAAPPEPTPRKPEPIMFEPGTTAGTYQRPIAAGEIQDYVVRAFEGQVMLVDVSSPNDDVYLGVSGVSDGVPVVRGSSNAMHWQGQLPATQDYVIRVAARGDDTSFTLRIIIPVNLAHSADNRTASVVGEVKPNQRMHYVLRGSAGETISLEVASPKQNAFLAITGLDDGQSVVSSASATTRWSGKLTRTQDYLVEVIPSTEPTEFTLDATVE